jgi:hypothetical protein
MIRQNGNGLAKLIKNIDERKGESPEPGGVKKYIGKTDLALKNEYEGERAY